MKKTKMTYREWINSMSDEHFAMWLIVMTRGDFDPKLPMDAAVYERILKKLKSEVEDD